MFMGDCRLPLLHMLHCGLIKPQKLGPENKKKIRSFVAYAIVSLGQRSEHKGRENNNLINVYRINNSTPANVKENLK